MNGFIGDIGRVLRRAGRLVTFRRPLDDDLTESPLAVLAVMALATLAAAYIDRAHAGDSPVFNVYGLSTHAANWAVFCALLALLFARTAPIPFARALADTAGVSLLYSILVIFLDAAFVEIERLTQLGYFERWLIEISYTVIVILFVLAVVWHTGRCIWRAHVRLPGARFAAAVALPLFLTPQQPLIYGPGTSWWQWDVWSLAQLYWQSTGDDSRYTENTEIDSEESLEARHDLEAVLYNQPDLVRKVLDGVHSSRVGKPQFYFVGAATDSSQDVFRREASGAKAVVDARLDSGGHSVLLINHWDTVAETPIASATNLSRVLEGVGRRMNVDEDVLVLFITAHGSPEMLSVTFPGFSLNMLTPERLARMLDDSGIRNRVLIISACYSGSFIPKLANENTLIMTAASSTRTSFGCSNEREWTYFGDALFNHALRETRSLSEAFAKARTLIETWEAEQGLTGSEPQISMGAEIARRLEAMQTPGSTSAQADSTMRR